jgi:hypothetical protein
MPKILSSIFYKASNCALTQCHLIGKMISKNKTITDLRWRWWCFIDDNDVDDDDNDVLLTLMKVG